MPVKAQMSEYQRNFPWRDSSLSAAYKPAQTVAAAPAGMPTTSSGAVMEPPLQRKKRSGEVSSSVPASVPVDEYTLIGDQKKFGASIKYRNKFQPEKSSKPSPAKKDKAKEPEVQTPVAPRPAPKVKVDTGAPPPNLPHQKTRATQSPNGVREMAKEEPSYATQKVKSGAPFAKVSSHTQTTKPEYRYREAEGEREAPTQEVHKKTQKPKAGVLKKSKLPKESISAPDMQALKEAAGNVRKPALSKGLPEKRHAKKGAMNEFTQTNLDKGVVDSAQEAPSDYAMKYKAGIAPPRSLGAKRRSEYQKQFTWMKGVPSSPLLAAEQVVYNSNPQVAPYKCDNVPKRSEYQMQFNPAAQSVSAPAISAAEPKPSKAKKPKLQRSASAESLTPDQRPAAGGEPVTSDEDKRLIMSSVNPQKLHFPHGRLRWSSSEYQSNFQPPQVFSYEEGTWRGARAPHVDMTAPKLKEAKDEQVAPATASSSQTSWFAEVMELRQKAQEYKRRAQGTHFSKQHLAQLYAQQADLWDTVSNRSTLSALSLERHSVKEGLVKDGHDNRSMSSGIPGSAREAWTSASQEADDEGAPSVASGPSTVRSRSTVRSLDLDEGRIPTPELRHGQSAQRHHLDRTTPLVGGALLTSPGRKKQEKKKKKKDADDASQVSVPASKDPSISSDMGVAAHASQSAPAVLSQPKVCCTCGAEISPRGRFTSEDLPLKPRVSDDKTDLNKPAKVPSKKPQQSRSSGRIAQVPGIYVSKPSSHSGVHSLFQGRRSVASATSMGSGKTTPTYGMATRDTHVLIDDDASTDRPLETQFVHSPQKVKPDGVPSTIAEETSPQLPKSWGSQYKGVKKTEAEDDLLSTSARSLASTASLAYEVYQRALKNREEFWGKSHVGRK